MKTFEKDFKNELGNQIQVQVSPKKMGGVEGVLISITGPTSLTENHVTRLEAEVIYEQLQLFLQQKNG